MMWCGENFCGKAFFVIRVLPSTSGLRYHSSVAISNMYNKGLVKSRFINIMAPPRVRGSGEDLRSEAFSIKDKQTSGSVASKGRRNVNSAVTTGSNIKDTTVAPSASTVQHGGQEGSSGV